MEHFRRSNWLVRENKILMNRKITKYIIRKKNQGLKSML